MTKFIDRYSLDERLQDRFWSKVDSLQDEDACWNWKAVKLPKGYGQFRISLKDGMCLAHRMAYALENADNPYININPEVVMHKCDNTSCCNPRHLMPGTMLSNAQDMMSKGRYGDPLLRGSKGTLNGSSKLTEEKVAEIKRLSNQGIINARLSEMFGVSRVMIGLIVNNKKWQHVCAA